MGYISLDLAKQHLVVDTEIDDIYITSLIKVAEDIVTKSLNINSLAEIDNGGNLPPAINQAILLLIGNFYANREPVGYSNLSKLPLSYHFLIDCYKSY